MTFTPFLTVEQRLTAELEHVLSAMSREDSLPQDLPAVQLSPPKQASHGDFATNIALAVAKAAGKKPRDLATQIQERLGTAGGLLDKTEVAGPGFLNLFVAKAAWRDSLAAVLEAGPSFLRSDHGRGQKVLIEFVSANPTGPLHVAHGRGAVTGDVVARLLSAAGFDVHREYYVNDLGHQADVLAESIFLRYGEMLGRPFDPPEDFYPGEYVTDIARAIAGEVKGQYLEQPREKWLPVFRDRGISMMLERIRADLEAFGITFDTWTSEKELTERVGLDGALKKLEEAGTLYVEEGKTWFASTRFGDDKDRVVVRDDGRTTYFASDVAYHANKLERGFTKLINVWGADHGGYLARVRASLAALGHDSATLDVIFVQLVSLTRGDEIVRMGKRLGTAVWLADVVAEAGRDATRYFFAMRRSDAQLVFDIDLASKKSLDNPVYYAQMGHARMCSIARKAIEEGILEPEANREALDALVLPEEIELIKAITRGPKVIVSAADAREPHQVVHYLQEMIAQFHSYYTQYKTSEKVISDDPEKTRARLLLCRALQMTLRVLLEEILGVDAPESMYLSASEAEELL